VNIQDDPAEDKQSKDNDSHRWDSEIMRWLCEMRSCLDESLSTSVNTGMSSCMSNMPPATRNIFKSWNIHKYRCGRNIFSYKLCTTEIKILEIF
jgi:hypothetical protein